MAHPRAPVASTSRSLQLDQFYTKPEIAAYFYAIFCYFFTPTQYLMVEPSAGMGAFLDLFPRYRFGIDLDPKRPDILKTDFLTVDIKSNRRIAVVGNPPFGTAAQLAIEFFNHSAKFSVLIAMILPMTFRKPSVTDALDLNFHCIYDEEVPKNAFTFEGKNKSVPTVFQVWVRLDTPRKRMNLPTTHRDFTIPNDPTGAHFAMQRVGSRAGLTHRDFARSRDTHYFIKCNVDPTFVVSAMNCLPLKALAENTAEQLSLSKGELIYFYSLFTGQW